MLAGDLGAGPRDSRSMTARIFDADLRDAELDLQPGRRSPTPSTSAMNGAYASLCARAKPVTPGDDAKRATATRLRRAGAQRTIQAC